MDPSESRAGRERAWEMSPGEKLMAQWEAQHDVAARGSRCDPLGLQHQLNRARMAEHAGAGRPHTAAPRMAPPPVTPPRAAPPQMAPPPVTPPPVTPPPADAPPADRPSGVPLPKLRRHPWLHRIAGRAHRS